MSVVYIDELSVPLGGKVYRGDRRYGVERWRYGVSFERCYQIGGQGRPVWMRGVLIGSQAGGKSCLAACGVRSHRFEILVKPNGQFRTAYMATIWPFRHRIAHVKPRGRLRRGYMALIAPFGHWVVYPTVMRQIESAWNTRERKER